MLIDHLSLGRVLLWIAACGLLEALFYVWIAHGEGSRRDLSRRQDDDIS
jgi:hypothetical protein